MDTKNAKYANLSLRIGLALVLLWSVKTKFSTPDKVSGMMNALGLSFASSGLVLVLAVVLAILAVSLIFNYKVKHSAWILSAFFAVTVILGIPNGFTVGPALWKDIGLLGASLSLAFSSE